MLTGLCSNLKNCFYNVDQALVNRDFHAIQNPPAVSRPVRPRTVRSGWTGIIARAAGATSHCCDTADKEDGQSDGQPRCRSADALPRADLSAKHGESELIYQASNTHQSPVDTANKPIRVDETSGKTKATSTVTWAQSDREIRIRARDLALIIMA